MGAASVIRKEIDSIARHAVALYSKMCSKSVIFVHR